ncbi:MAG: C4-dicarboxylate ABC transporter permease [Hyphomicrobiales bacterium]|nr:MAG: C4-dicarboxylate ABC transporter permease [Hyphomicrobiales bacterium]
MTAANWRARAEMVFLYIDKALLTISNTALLIILLTIFWTVWSRYVIRSPVAWSEDVTSTSFAWFIFISMAAVYNRRGHVGIDIITSLLPSALQQIVAGLGDVFMVIFCAYTAYLCGLQSVVSHTTAATTVLHIPLSYYFASLTIGFGLMSLRSASFLFGVPPIPREE